MKFTQEVLVNVPVEHLLSLLSDPEHSRRWQPEIQRIEWLSGVPGAAGSSCRHHIRLPNGRRVTAEETVIRRDPDGTEESLGLTNGIEHHVLARVLPTPEGSVRWVVEHDLRMAPARAVVGFFFEPVVRRQCRAQMARFAAWVEQTHRAQAL